MLFSIIVPVYNRPDEIVELLESLCNQTYTILKSLSWMMVLILDVKREVICLPGQAGCPKYYYKENSGQGFSRNFGFERAKGDYFVVFDSDCIIPLTILKR
jgi:glycosyltransferase involved in cell wall biosynthesis